MNVQLSLSLLLVLVSSYRTIPLVLRKPATNILVHLYYLSTISGVNKCLPSGTISLEAFKVKYFHGMVVSTSSRSNNTAFFYVL